MDFGTIALIASPFLGLIGIALGTTLGRRSSKENNDTQRFAAFTAALETRIASLEERLTELEQTNQRNEGIISTLREAHEHALRTSRAQLRYIKKLLRLIQHHAPSLSFDEFAPSPDDVEYIVLDTSVSPIIPPKSE